MNNNQILNTTLITIIKEFREKISDQNIGLWCFRYIFDKRSLVTWEFIPSAGATIRKSTKDLIENAEIPEGHGSIGYMMLKKKPVIISDTFADPRSTVSEIDDEIQQKSALCYPIINQDKEIIIALDFFTSKENFFNHNHITILDGIVNKHKDLLSNFYSFSLNEDLINIYNEDIKIPKREIGESLDEFVSKCNKEFLLRFLSIITKQARVPILELQLEDDKKDYKQEKLLFNPEEIKKILLQELLLCNYKSKWSKNCAIINGASENDCDCCQPPLDTIIDQFLNLQEDTIREEFPQKDQEDCNYRIVIFTKKLNVNYSKLVEQVEPLINDFFKKINDNSDPKTIKVELDKFENKLNNEIYNNLTEDFKNNIKCILLFIKSPKVYRFEKDIRSINGLEFLRSNPSYLNQSTIGALTASLVDPNVLNEYPPNFITHDGVSIELQNGMHSILNNEKKKVDLNWEEKNYHKDLFHIYISGKWIEEIVSSGINNDDLKKKIIKYFQLKKNEFLIVDTNKVIIWSPYLIKEKSKEKFRQYIVNLYNYYETSISRERTLKSAVKSAIAAIMSRNGSHNLGSHVLSSVSQNFNELSDDKLLFTYIQQRMDFIAQITTEIPEWYYPCSFVQDLMRRFYMQRHLLTYICGAEGLKGFEYQKNGRANNESAPNDIIIKVLKKEDTSGSKEIIGPSTNLEQEITELTQVAIPGGIVGQHAFYTILENFLRNTAKHNWTEFKTEKKLENLEIYIEYDDDPKKDYVVINIWDNVSFIYEPDIDNEKKMYFAEKLGIEEECKEYHDKVLHFKINSMFKKHFIKPSTGKLRNENWGLAEMKICAAYLNKIDVTEMGLDDSIILFGEEDGKKHGIIRAKARKYNDDYRLCYEFAIPKPKELLITGIKSENILKSKDEARKYNVYLSDKLPQQIDHELIVFLDPTEIKFDDIYNLELFPFKLILLCRKNGTELTNKKNIEELINKRRLVWIQESYDDLIEKINTDKEVFWNKLKLELNRQWLIGYYESVIEGLEKDTYLTVQTVVRNGNPGGSSISNNSLKKFLKSIGVKEENIKHTDQEPFQTAKKILVKYEEDIETLPVNYKATGGIVNQKEASYNLISDKNLIIKREPPPEILTKNNGIHYLRHLTTWDTNNKFIYQEALSGSQIYYNLLSIDDLYYQAKLNWMLLENAFLKIGIADERFINYFYKNAGDRRKYLNANIIPIFNFEYNSFGKKSLVSEADKENELKRKIDKYLDIKYSYNFNSQERVFDVVIFHQTILDEYFKSDTNEMINFTNSLKKLGILFVVTSGRGKPDKLPFNVKFLPFSNLESFLLKKYPEKFLLTLILMLLKRKKG